ncbi:MAG TPA: hypothetical protein VFI65_27380 [Streptosporangiaceae bacterium]|nr:hypothetical protein [Streptosporangiaceae bacterium]
MLRTEHDIEAALLTLMPDPATDANVIEAVHRRIARRRTTTRATVAAASAAAVGVAASLVLAIAPSGSRITHANAAVELRTLSKVAAAQPGFKMPGPGQFFYTETRWFGPTCLKPAPRDGWNLIGQHCSINMLTLLRTQTWISADGSGRALTTTISNKFASAGDRARWIAAGRPSLTVNNSDHRYRKHQLVIGESGLGKLPTNPVKLAKVIHDRKWEGGPKGPGEDYTQVRDLIRLPNASPKLRAAAFEVGTRIPGIKSLGTDTFRGVSGAAIAYIGKYPKGSITSVELIFDRATSTLKAEVFKTTKGGKTVYVQGTAYLKSGLVNSTHSTPR